MDKRRSIPPLGKGRPRTDTPGATPTSRPVRSGPAEGSLGRIRPGVTIGNIPPLPQREASGMPGPRPRALGAPSSATGTVCATTPTRVVDNLHGISAPTRVISPSRCQQPPHNVDNPLAVPTTRARAGRARAPRARNPPTPNNARPCEARHRPASPLGESPGLVPLPPGYAHKDPDLRNTRCTQRLDSALVCDPVFPNSLPCVRPRGGRADNGGAPRPVNPRRRRFRPRPRASPLFRGPGTLLSRRRPPNATPGPCPAVRASVGPRLPLARRPAPSAPCA